MDVLWKTWTNMVITLMILLISHMGVIEASVPDCKGAKADIVFLLDASRSVTAGNFHLQKEFVANVSQTFDIGPNHVQISVVTFANLANNEFNLDAYSSKPQLVQAIKGITYKPGSTATGLALYHVRVNSFSAKFGARGNVPRILIVMTDGKSTNPTQTKGESTAVHRLNITVIAVGIGGVAGDGIDGDELKTIASGPDSVFISKDFASLYSVYDRLLQATCSAGQRGYKSCDGHMTNAHGQNTGPCPTTSSKASTKMTKPTRPTTKPTQPTTKPTRPTTKPTRPTTTPTKPTTKPTQPTTKPTRPTTKPTRPTTKPTKPTTKPTQPTTKPTKPTTKPTKPTTKPKQSTTTKTFQTATKRKSISTKTSATSPVDSTPTLSQTMLASSAKETGDASPQKQLVVEETKDSKAHVIVCAVFFTGLTGLVAGPLMYKYIGKLLAKKKSEVADKPIDI